MILLDGGLDCLATSKIAEDGIALLREYCLMKKRVFASTRQS
jgi:hypothetical protein